MSDPSEPATSIWEFAIGLYGHDGVEADLLRAQDVHRLDVTALIFGLYRARQDKGFDAAVCVRLARDWACQVVDHLRAARIALKSAPPQLDTVATHTLRLTVKSAELEAERLILVALASQECVDPSQSASDALASIAQASLVVVDLDLAALLKRLAIAAENMRMT